MADIIFQLDSSAQTVESAQLIFKMLFPRAELRAFSKYSIMSETLENHAELFPKVIFINFLTMQNESLETLDWLKRHAQFHHIPIVLMVEKITDELKIHLKKMGVFDFIQYPIIEGDAKEVFKRCEENALDHETLGEMDRDFAAELAEQIESFEPLIKNLNDENAKELYRHLHTIKGCSSSLQFPHIAEVVHKGEGLLGTLQKHKNYEDSEAKNCFKQLGSFLLTQTEGIRTQSLLPKADTALFTGLADIQKRIVERGDLHTSGKTKVDPASVIAETQNSEDSRDDGNGVVFSKSAASMRISNNALDDLQDKFKKVLQVRTKISSFANSLKAEFPDEGFPDDLVKMVKELGDASAKIMEFFINLRVVPISRLHGFCNRLVQQTASQLAKKCHFEFIADKTLELDQSIISILEGCVTHLIRNSIDHGLESPSERTAVGKNDTGLLTLEIERLGSEQVKFALSDDGKGINIDKLKTIVVEKGIFPAAAIETMSNDQLAELIFVDGLSTRSEASDTSGRGVGMSAVKADIEGLGGQLKIRTEKAKGTTFTMIVPRFFKL